MNDISYYIVLGVLAVIGLVMALRHRKNEDPLVSRRRYTAIIIDIAAIALVSLFRFGALGMLLGGC
jgi:hypothetical protein